jgi:hypothetical protein
MCRFICDYEAWSVVSKLTLWGSKNHLLPFPKTTYHLADDQDQSSKSIAEDKLFELYYALQPLKW